MLAGAVLGYEPSTPGPAPTPRASSGAISVVPSFGADGRPGWWSPGASERRGVTLHAQHLLQLGDDTHQVLLGTP
jgi:hypothetical protein